MPLSDHLRVLSRPAHRYGDMPDPKVKTWELTSSSGGEFQDVKKEQAAIEVHEKEAITRWIRKGQDGGVEAIAKDLNRSLTYCRDKLRGFETTNRKNRWNGVGDKTMNSTHSSICSSIQF